MISCLWISATVQPTCPVQAWWSHPTTKGNGIAIYLKNLCFPPLFCFFSSLLNSHSKYSGLLGEATKHWGEISYLYLTPSQHNLILYFVQDCVFENRIASLLFRIFFITSGSRSQVFPKTMLLPKWLHCSFFPIMSNVISSFFSSIFYSLQFLLLAFCKLLSSHTVNKCHLVWFRTFLHSFLKFYFPGTNNCKCSSLSMFMDGYNRCYFLAMSD